MSDMMRESEPWACQGDAHGPAEIQVYPAKAAALGGGLKIRRALPARGKRMIGAWCFLDHFGPLSFGDRKAMDVAPHPHIGLQTVTWLLRGEILHKDSLGYEQIIRPGQLNVMTAGKGITHSEETPPQHSGEVHGVQLWVALPDRDRHCDPDFEHHPELPVWEADGRRIQVFLGEAFGMQSPARAFTPIMGADVRLAAGTHALPLATHFEHGLLVVAGRGRVGDVVLEPGFLYDLGMGREALTMTVADELRFVIVGGEPFDEKIIMWWNFVARTHEEIAQAAADWQAGRHFDPVPAYSGDALSAPDLQRRLR